MRASIAVAIAAFDAPSHVYYCGDLAIQGHYVSNYHFTSLKALGVDLSSGKKYRNGMHLPDEWAQYLKGAVLIESVLSPGLIAVFDNDEDAVMIKLICL